MRNTQADANPWPTQCHTSLVLLIHGVGGQGRGAAKMIQNIQVNVQYVCRRHLVLRISVLHTGG